MNEEKPKSKITIDLQRTVVHPDFDRMFERDIHGFPVCCFSRKVFIEPTTEQLTKFQRKKKAVEKLGGYMYKKSWECAGKNPCFTEQDCEEMIQAVLNAFPDWKIRDTWNSPGTYRLSVSIIPKDWRPN